MEKSSVVFITDGVITCGFVMGFMLNVLVTAATDDDDDNDDDDDDDDDDDGKVW